MTIVGAECSPPGMGSPGFHLCFAKAKVADIPVQETFIFEDEQLVDVMILFPEQDRGAVIRDFVRRYGEPTGASKPGTPPDALTWVGKAVTLTIIPKGALFRLNSYDEKLKAQPKKPVKRRKN